jgi:DNA-binding CsgD family transcriptional regulator
MTQCPVSGLAVTEKDHWSFEHRQGNYTRKYSLIGTAILHVQEIADHDIAPEQLYADDFKSLASEENLTGKPLYLLMDFAHVGDLNFSYKKEFIALLSDPDSNIRLITAYNIRPSVRLQIEMLQALASDNRPMILTESYADALTAISEFCEGNHSDTSQKPDPQISPEPALRKAFLAGTGAMLLLSQFDQETVMPPENSTSYFYFQVLNLLQKDMKALENEHQQIVERIEQEFRTLLASKNNLLDSQIELNKKNEQILKDEQSSWQSRIAAQELETTRISTANAEKTSALREICEIIETLDLDPAIREKISGRCNHLFEASSTANLVNTDLTETDSVFISRLQKRHPNLNQRELRISLLIKLDYHSRDIARTLGLSTRGIESIRYRLHKKVGLDRHRSLKTYLSDLATEAI